MKLVLKESQFRESLEELAAEGISEGLNLWPAICQQLQAQPRAVPRSPFGWVSRRLVLMPVTAVLLGALLIAFLVLTGTGERDSNSAAEVLNSLAKVAAAQSLPLASGGYRYMKSEEMDMVTVAGQDGQFVTALVPKTREYWVAPDGSGRIREEVASPLFFSEHDRVAWQAVVPSSLNLGMNEDFGPGRLDYEDFARYPTDPNALADVIRKRASAGDPDFNIERFFIAGNILRKPDGQPEFSAGGRLRIRREATDPLFNVEMFFTVADLLRIPGAPPELRSALYKVAAKIDGVELIGRMTDRAGRPGVAVALTTNYWGPKQRMILIFDPATSALLGEEKVLLENVDWVDAKPPVVTGYATYLESAVVEKLP